MIFSRIMAAGLAVLLILIGIGASWGSTRPAWGSALTPTTWVEPAGCWEPPDDYTRVWVNGVQLNTRTLAMLDHAQVLYRAQGGSLDFRVALTQGSYNAGGVAASFGTHDGGGAVDLAVRRPQRLVRADQRARADASRAAGGRVRRVAARYRRALPGSSPIHIHAVAVGDQEHAEAARAQIDGRFGYLRGYNGLPQVNGFPIADGYGGRCCAGGCWRAAMPICAAGQSVSDARGHYGPTGADPITRTDSIP